MKTSIPRLRRVRFNDGRVIEVLRTKPSDDALLRKGLSAIPEWATKNDRPLAGYAIVVWDAEGYSRADLRTNGRIPSILAPDFVRNRLLADTIEDWILDTLNGK